jgi:hypothetical protein
MARAVTRAVAPALILVLAACAASGRRSGGSEARYLLTVDEIRASGFTDAYRAVEALRPQWLRLRGVTTFTGRESVKVYIDELLLGGPDQLQQIPTASIAYIRYLDGNEATQRWGLNHGQGAILVFTRPN